MFKRNGDAQRRIIQMHGAPWRAMDETTKNRASMTWHETIRQCGKQDEEHRVVQYEKHIATIEIVEDTEPSRIGSFAFDTNRKRCSS